MDQFDTLKLKYQGVINFAKQAGVSLSHVHLQDGKLFIQGRAPSQQAKNDVWNQIKLIDPNFSDLTADLTVDESLAPPPPPEQIYTVKKGDSLWKIAQDHLGNGALYPKIIAANPDRLKDEHSVIHPGDQLIIPNLPS